jgi:NadR type nicotinamide-nucleotide adenylyltransferase
MGEADFHHGLVIGKFFPPHRGHAFLVRSAAQFCGRVTVGVFDHPSAALPLDVRSEALRELAAPFGNVTVVHEVDDVPIDYDDPSIWDRHVEIFRRGVRKATADTDAVPVDAVFTSEPYGDELARRFGCAHVNLDRDRTWEPISGTAIRADPIRHWNDLLPGARARLAKRVVIVGAESTGTTTLARDLAAALSTPGCVPEFGREYTMQKLAVLRARKPAATMDSLSWSAADFALIAATQNRFEREAARHGGPLIVCDTDVLATQIWHERYRGGGSDDVERAIRDLAPFRLYLLTHNEGVPFEDDGLRDGRHVRSWMTERFEATLRERGVRFEVLRGTRRERARAALTAAWTFMAEPWSWG